MITGSRTIPVCIGLLLAALLVASVGCGAGGVSDSPAGVPAVAEPTAPAPTDARPADGPGTPASSAAQSGDATAGDSGATASTNAATDESPQTEPRATTVPTLAPPTVLVGADDIPQIGGIDAWLNTDLELQIGALAAEGKVVLIDFWTYTCINCIRTLPFLRDWWVQYEDDGLVILGIHTPEFEFEKDYQNVADAIATHDIGWPVAQDNNRVTWRNFENRYWPAKYLFNARGELIYFHFGEGAYAETEERIRNALVEAGADLTDDPLNLPEDQSRDPAFQTAANSGRAAVTPELYAGWHRNFLTARAGRPPYVAQAEYFQVIDITDDEAIGIIDVSAPDFSMPDGVQPHAMYFQGQWSVEPERIRHARITENLEDYLGLKYAAKSVNAVLTSDSGEPYRVYLTVDGAMLTPQNAGEDVQWDENGTSYVLVDEPRMYGLVNNPQYLPESVLVMGSNSDDFGLFAFTFGVYAEGP